MLAFKKIMSMVLALVMVAGMLPVQAFGTETEPVMVEETIPETEETAAVTETTAATSPEETTEETEEPQEETTLPEETVEETAEETQSAEKVPQAEEPAEPVYVPGNPETECGELFGCYMNRLFFGDCCISPLGILARDTLSFGEQHLYDGLKAALEKIASGQQTSTIVTVDFGGSGHSVSEDMLDPVFEALEHDCPYEMYWYDGYYYRISGGAIQFWLQVSVTFQPEGYEMFNPQIDTAHVGRAVAAAENARSIVARYAHLSDYEKLAAYADAICGMVAYDKNAVDNQTWAEDINPWTLLNVFDGDSSTNVACEGYAESFQYLCDLSSFFREIACYSPTGANHKWNIVRIEGKSYLVDLTMGDLGDTMDRENYLLAGGKGSVEDGYQIGGFHYTYYAETIRRWGAGPDSVLNLSETKYDPAKDPDPPKVIASGSCGAGLTWTLDNYGTLTISGTGAMTSYTDRNVEKKMPWYAYRESITEVVIKDGITRIGDYSFWSLRSLTKVQIPDSVTYIGDCAFSFAAFTAVTLPENLTGIGFGAFHSCKSLKSIDIPDGVTEIELCAFESCVALKNIDLPSGLEKIGQQAFSGCIAMESITFPAGLKEIGNIAFAGCNALKRVIIPGTVTSIGSLAFHNCPALEYAEIQGDHAVIGADAFYLDPSLKTVVIGEGVEEIGSRAFGSCEALKTIEIPGSVKRIGANAFVACEALETVIFNNGIKTIDARAFLGCRKLTEITLPNTLEAIGKEAFNGCVKLKKVSFTGPAPDIDAQAFGDNGETDENVRATVYYPGDPSWTEDKLQDYGGKLTWVVDACLDGHDVVIDAAVEPGCAVSGLTEGSHCADCGEVVVAQEMIPATRHDFVDGICLNCGGEDKADYVLFSGKSLGLQEMNPATGKAYTAKQIAWTLAEGGEAYATLAANGKLTASAIYEQVRIEAVATIAQEKKQIIRLIDLSPAISGLDVLREGEIVTGKTVNMGFTDDALVLTAQTQPYDIPGVTWTISDTKGQYAEYTIDGSSLTIENPTGKAGTVTIKAAIDAGGKKNVTVKVAFGGFAKTVEITDPVDTDLKGGESLTLTAAITEPDVVTKPGIVWSISDKTAATVSGGKVKAKNVTNPTWVTVTATSKDGLASDSVELRILPKNEGQLVLMAGDAFVTNANKVLDKGESLWLSAAVITEGLPVPVEAEWTSSKAAVASVDETGMVMANANGTAKITAQYGKMKAVVNVKVTTLAKTLEITTKDGKNLDADGNVVVASGKNVTLTVNIHPKDAAKAVNWEIVEGGQYAKISNGKVTATKNLTEIRYASVKATAKDGSDVSGTIQVKILPLATGIQLYREDMAIRTGSTYIHDMMESTVLNLSAKVYPAQASQGLELTSSGKKIADFNEEGQLVCYKPGTVTITAKALDGSNKKVSFKLTIVKKVTSLSLKEGSSLTVIGGKSLKLAPMVEVGPGDATNKKLTWKVSDNAYGIKISSAGVLSTKKVTVPVTVNVMVTTQDGSGKMLSFDVTVNPA